MPGIYGNTTNNWRAYADYSTSSTDTTLTVSVDAGFQSVNWGFSISSGISTTITLTGQDSASGSGGASTGYGETAKRRIASKSWTLPRGASAYAVTLGVTTRNASGYMNGTSSKAVAITVPALPQYAPEPVTGVESERVSDAKNVLSWANHPDATHPYNRIYVDRSVDGGEWSEAGRVSGSADSFADTSTAANHSYRYRVCAMNDGGWSAHAESGTTYNTPAAPAKVTAVRKAEAAVLVAIDNPARTATALELQRSADGASWATVATVSGTVTETSDEPGGGVFRYRARNTRGVLASAWSPASEPVVTICPPSAPTLRSPASSTAVPTSMERIRLSWAHNPLDGSAQTAAEVAYTVDGGATWETAEAADAWSVEIANAYPPNTIVQWRARTKGAHADFGPWSELRSFRVLQAPMCYFQEPGDGFVVQAMPLEVSIVCDDPSGAPASVTLEAHRGGRLVHSRDMGTSLSCSIGAAEWLPDNGASYTLRATVRSTSTLDDQCAREVSVGFLEPARGVVEWEADCEDGTVAVAVTIPEPEDGLTASAASANLYRNVGGNRKLLVEGIEGGAGFNDRYAPLNTDYAYEVATFAESGAVAVASFPARVASPWFQLYFDGGAARAMWDPQESSRVARPADETVAYWGRAYPVRYEGDQLSDKRTVSGMVETREQARAFRRLAESGGRAVYKSCEGDVMHVAVTDVSDSPALTVGSYYGGVSVSLERIDGEEL